MNHKTLRAQTKLDTTTCPERDVSKTQESCTVPASVSPVNRGVSRRRSEVEACFFLSLRVNLRHAIRVFSGQLDRQDACMTAEGLRREFPSSKVGISTRESPLHQKQSACSTNHTAQQLGRYNLRTEAGETRSVKHFFYRPERGLFKDGELAAFFESTDRSGCHRFNNDLLKNAPKDVCRRFASDHNAAKGPTCVS